MLLIPCPWCGARAQTEFSYRGDASVQWPAEADSEVSAAEREALDKEWFEFVYLRGNPAGEHAEWWYHGAGCEQWIKVKRDTRTHQIHASAKADESL